MGPIRFLAAFEVLDGCLMRGSARGLALGSTSAASYVELTAPIPGAPASARPQTSMLGLMLGSMLLAAVPLTPYR